MAINTLECAYRGVFRLHLLQSVLNATNVPVSLAEGQDIGLARVS